MIDKKLSLEEATRLYNMVGIWEETQKGYVGKTDDLVIKVENLSYRSETETGKYKTEESFLFEIEYKGIQLFYNHKDMAKNSYYGIEEKIREKKEREKEMNKQEGIKRIKKLLD
jgi:hypothetical protein